MVLEEGQRDALGHAHGVGSTDADKDDEVEDAHRHKTDTFVYDDQMPPGAAHQYDGLHSLDAPAPAQQDGTVGKWHNEKGQTS